MREKATKIVIDIEIVNSIDGDKNRESQTVRGAGGAGEGVR